MKIRIVDIDKVSRQHKKELELLASTAEKTLKTSRSELLACEEHNNRLVKESEYLHKLKDSSEALNFLYQMGRERIHLSAEWDSYSHKANFWLEFKPDVNSYIVKQLSASKSEYDQTKINQLIRAVEEFGCEGWRAERDQFRGFILGKNFSYESVQLFYPDMVKANARMEALANKLVETQKLQDIVAGKVEEKPCK